jgi:hypothetical protein
VDPFLTKQLREFVQQKGRLPADFGELARASLDSRPRALAGMTWVIDPTTQEVKAVRQKQMRFMFSSLETPTMANSGPQKEDMLTTPISARPSKPGSPVNGNKNCAPSSAEPPRIAAKRLLYRRHVYRL